MQADVLASTCMTLACNCFRWASCSLPLQHWDGLAAATHLGAWAQQFQSLAGAPQIACPSLSARFLSWLRTSCKMMQLCLGP